MSLRVRKRDGVTLQEYQDAKVQKAIGAAALDAVVRIEDGEMANLLSEVHTLADEFADANDIVDVEDIQDAVERTLMGVLPAVAKSYILYRDQRAEARKARLHPDPEAIADYIHPGKYSRHLPAKRRRETYPETVARSQMMHLRKYGHIPGLPQLIEDAFQGVFDKELLPSMRSMQFGGQAILSQNCRMFNCSCSLCDRPRFFAEALYLLLCGTGVGFSVQFEHVEKLPALGRIDETRVKHFVIPDCIEGWADAVEALFTAAIEGYYVEFAYQQIRDRGRDLKTSGGKAPGHLPLRRALEKVRCILLGAQGRQLRPVECFRIMCTLADAVLSGGIRRSAMICLFSLDDGEMLNAKTGEWHKDWPEYQNANISVVLKRDEVKKPQFKRVFRMTRQWGEPGFFFTNNPDYGANPCLSADARIATSHGMVRMGELFQRGGGNEVLTDNRVTQGDALLDSPGVKLKPASAVHLTQRHARVYELTTRHGYRLRATANHVFPTPQGRKRLDELVPGDVILLQSGEGCFGATGSFDEGFVLGAITGNGCVHKDEAFLDLWEQDFDQADTIRAMVQRIVSSVPASKHPRYSTRWQHAMGTCTCEKRRIGGRRLRRWLDDTAGGGFKQRVPEYIWRGSRPMAVGYLQGLFSTDGTVNVAGSGSAKTVSLRLGQASKPFLQDVQQLLANFGIVSRLYLRREAGQRRLPDGHGGERLYACKDFYEVILNRPNCIRFMDAVGLMGRKGEQLIAALEARGTDCRKPERFITVIESIDYAGDEDVYCLKEPQTNTIIANGIVTGQCVEIGLNPVLKIDSDSVGLIHQWMSDIADRPDKQMPQYQLPKLLRPGEQFTGWQFCNLVEQNAAKFKTPEDFYRTARRAAVIGTLQAGYMDFAYLGWVSEIIARREALIGVGMTGIMDAPQIALNPEYQRKAAQIVKQTNAEVARLIGIRPAARCTCVKPSGTTSLELGCVGSGIHPHHARRYFRRVVANELEPVFRYFRSVNPHMCVKKPNGDWVIEFPVEAPAGAIVSTELSAIQFLEKVLSTQINWVETGTARPESSPGLIHNVSNTVIVREGEWDAVAEFIWANRDHFNGVSLLPATGDKDYAFAPREAVLTPADEAKWNYLLKNYKPVDYLAMVEDEDGTNHRAEAACAGGVCELV